MRLLCCLFLLTPFVYAEEDAPAPRKCVCIEGQGSYLYLRCPKAPPADPDPCPATIDGKSHPAKPLPDAWNDMCWMNNRMACFLRRHAASWDITCSLCVAKKCCPFPNWGNCPNCHGEKTDPDMPELIALQAATAKFRKIGGKRIQAAMSPHYVFITDIPRLKIATSRGAPRVVSTHELLHIYLQRAEMARRDFTKVFGAPREMRSMICLTWSEGVRRQFSGAMFGNTGTNLIYGGGGNKYAAGLAGNGFCLSGRDDDDLHFNTRHMIGHLCISTYHSGNPHEKHLPQWIFRGAAHWLSKLHPRGKNHAYFCSYEGVEVSGSGSRWHDKAKKIAARGPERDPVEQMLQAATAKQMNYKMHIRAWSWWDIFTREQPEPFVAFVKSLREAKEARVACKEAFGQAPEYVDDRWRERVLGKRRDVEATNREKEKEVDADAAGRRELRDIANERDVHLLASKIRGLERCHNIRTARLLVSLIDSRNSDRVREVIALVLERTRSPEVLEYLRGDGYRKAGKLGKATLCRMFGVVKHKEAIPLMREAMKDGYWLVKADAMRALARLGDTESIPAIAGNAASAPNGKVKVAAMDALGGFGKDAGKTIAAWERNLMSRSWQIQVATCDAFRAIGSTNAMEMLIGRLDAEGGRVRDEIETALKEISGNSQELNGEQWRKWWKNYKKFGELDRKMREKLEKERKAKEEAERRRQESGRTVARKKTGPPTYYGIKVYARAVGYVIDNSLSMQQGFHVSEGWQRRLNRKYTATTRLGVVKQEIAQSIEELDPRTRINLVFFNSRVRTWKPAPVPAGAMGGNAVSAVKNLTPQGQTNYYDALRAILGMEGDRGGWRAGFADTPDTLFFLTDGTPTEGEITKSDELLSWWNERNRFNRLRVHVIAMGTTSVDIDFLRKFAEQNKGKFVHMTGKH